MFNDLTDILKEIESDKRNLTDISKETGVKYDRLYSYTTGKAKPKAEDFVKLQNWYAKLLRKKQLNGEESKPTNDFAHIKEADTHYYTIKDYEVEQLKELLKESIASNEILRAKNQTMLDDIEFLKYKLNKAEEELAKYKPPDDAKNSGARTA